eukprot:1075506-Rhodomonas_salina.1
MCGTDIPYAASRLRARYAMSGTDIAYGYALATRCPVRRLDPYAPSPLRPSAPRPPLCHVQYCHTSDCIPRISLCSGNGVISLCACYAMSGTDIACQGPDRNDARRGSPRRCCRAGTSLRTSYGMSGTDLASTDFQPVLIGLNSTNFKPVPICLCTPYAMCGTNFSYCTTRERSRLGRYYAVCLRVYYARASTNRAYGSSGGSSSASLLRGPNTDR